MSESSILENAESFVSLMRELDGLMSPLPDDPLLKSVLELSKMKIENSNLEKQITNLEDKLKLHSQFNQRLKDILSGKPTSTTIVKRASSHRRKTRQFYKRNKLQTPDPIKYSDCNYCKGGFYREKDLREHYLKKHGLSDVCGVRIPSFLIDPIPMAAEKVLQEFYLDRFICPDCHRTFLCQNNLHLHRRTYC